MSKDQLAIFKDSNNHVKVETKDNIVTISKPWGHDDCFLRFDVNDPDLMLLNNIVINPRFDAIIHRKERLIEFIFAFINPSDQVDKDLIGRKFTFYLDKNKYNCYYEEPTRVLWLIARNFVRLPSDIQTVSQLNAFKDYQQIDQLPESVRPHAKRYFSKRKPISFYVKLTKNEDISANLPQIASSINFLMRYYDRESPYIFIRDEPCERNSKKMRYIPGVGFPSSLSIKRIDDIVLQWMEKACSSSIRQQFLFYYQILEYMSFYYLDKDTKFNIQKVMKNPTFLDCSDSTLNQIIDIIKSDASRNDEAKITSTITECIDVDIIFKEIEHDIDFFRSPVVFEGGLELVPLVREKDLKPEKVASVIKDMMQVIVKIRNCIVHGREKREIISITPSSKNDELLRRIIPLLRRMAEHVILYC